MDLGEEARRIRRSAKTLPAELMETRYTRRLHPRAERLTALTIPT
jgi:hypothetical protein